MLLFVIAIFVWMLFYTVFFPCAHQNTKHIKSHQTTSHMQHKNLTQQTAPPHHYPSQLLSLSSLSDWATELLRYWAVLITSKMQKLQAIKSRYKNG